MSSIKKFSIKELEAELQRRKDEREEKGKEEQRVYSTRVESLLSCDVPLLATSWIDTLAPEHDRISCADDNRTNSFYTGSVGPMPRCKRCALLDLMEGRPFPDGIVLQLSFDRHDFRPPAE